MYANCFQVLCVCVCGVVGFGGWCGGGGGGREMLK